MYVVLIISLLAILFTYLESQSKMKNGMAIGFVLVALIAAIRYNYGNDYMNYYQAYQTIISHSFTLDVQQLSGIYREPGWTLLNFLFGLFGDIGFFVMVAALAIFQNWVYYRFIKRFVPLQYRWLSVFVYLFNTSLYLLNMSMLRQGLAIAMFVMAIPYIVDKKWIIAMIIILLCSTIHSSAMVLLPFAFWGYIRFSGTTSKIVSVLMLVVFVVLVFNRDLLDNLILITSNVEELQEYAETYIKDEENSFKLGLAFAINSIPFITSIFYLSQKEDVQKSKAMVSLVCFASIISPFGQVSQMITRLAFYFQAVAIATLPIVYYWCKPVVRNVLIIVYVLMMGYSYFMFFHSPTWIDYYYTYRTIFSL